MVCRWISSASVHRFAGPITLNDDRDPSAGQGGSSHRYDAFLEHKFAASGDYYLKVSKYYDQEVPLSTDYDLNISLTNHPLWSTVPVTYNSSSGGFEFTPDSDFVSSNSAQLIIDYQIFDKSLNAYIQNQKVYNASAITFAQTESFNVNDEAELVNLVGMTVEITSAWVLAGFVLSQPLMQVHHIDSAWDTNQTPAVSLRLSAGDSSMFIDSYSVLTSRRLMPRLM